MNYYYNSYNTSVSREQKHMFAVESQKQLSSSNQVKE